MVTRTKTISYSKIILSVVLICSAFVLTACSKSPLIIPRQTFQDYVKNEFIPFLEIHYPNGKSTEVRSLRGFGLYKQEIYVTIHKINEEIIQNNNKQSQHFANILLLFDFVCYKTEQTAELALQSNNTSIIELVGYTLFYEYRNNNWELYRIIRIENDHRNIEVPPNLKYIKPNVIF